MPMVIAAMVIVIMSIGIFDHPITPKTTIAPNRFGRMPIIDSATERKSTKNINAIPNITTPIVLICEANKLWSMLDRKSVV